MSETTTQPFIVNGLDACELPDGSAVLLHSVDGVEVDRPHSAQIVYRGRLTGHPTMNDWPKSNRRYLVLWVKR